MATFYYKSGINGVTEFVSRGCSGAGATWM